MLKNENILTFLELKNSMVFYPHLEEKVADCIYQFGQQKKTILFSANHPSVKLFGEIAPDVRLLFPFDNWIFDYGAYCHSHDITACMPYYHALTREVVTEIKANGIAIYPWGIDETEEMRDYLKMGVDGILTNRPDRLRDLLQTQES